MNLTLTNSFSIGQCYHALDPQYDTTVNPRRVESGYDTQNTGAHRMVIRALARHALLEATDASTDGIDSPLQEDVVCKAIQSLHDGTSQNTARLFAKTISLAQRQRLWLNEMNDRRLIGWMIKSAREALEHVKIHRFTCQKDISEIDESEQLYVFTVLHTMFLCLMNNSFSQLDTDAAGRQHNLADEITLTNFNSVKNEDEKEQIETDSYLLSVCFETMLLLVKQALHDVPEATPFQVFTLISLQLSLQDKKVIALLKSIQEAYQEVYGFDYYLKDDFIIENLVHINREIVNECRTSK